MSLDSMVNIAFPSMAASFHRPPEAMRWIIICYVLTYSIMSFVGGALADRLGYARVFCVGLAGTALAFGVAATAPAFGWLIAGRVLQGFGCGLVYGTAPGLTTLAAAPAARGRALGFLNAAIGLAGTVGPIGAGALVDAAGWASVFAARVPLAVGVLAWAWVALPASSAGGAYRIVGAGDLLRGFVVRACGLSFVANGAIFAIWLLAPFYLVDLRGEGALTGGVVFMLTPLGTALAAPIAGRLVDRLGLRLPLICGLALESIGLLAMSRATVEIPIGVVAVSLFVAGFGLGLFQVPNMAIVMKAFPAAHQGAAGGLSFMARTLGVVSGVAALSAIFAARRAADGFERAFATAFVVAAAAVAAATVAAIVPNVRAAARGAGEPATELDRGGTA